MSTTIEDIRKELDSFSNEELKQMFLEVETRLKDIESPKVQEIYHQQIQKIFLQ